MVEPEGRHIQMLFIDLTHGLSDRIFKYFRPLVAMGIYYNATVHLAGGGPKRFLTGDHTLELAESWGRYFDLEANGGNPWHATRNFRGCKEIRWPYGMDEMMSLFDDGSLCVNFLVKTPAHGFLYGPPNHWKAELPVSAEIVHAAKRFRDRYNVPERYGACHIRRCDLLTSNRMCTQPQAILQSIREARKDLTTWVFFMYAEPGYREALNETLAPLSLKLIFEDGSLLNDAHPEDNYFSYLLGKYLNGGAETVLETHSCSRQGKAYVLDGKGLESHGIYLAREVAEAVCDDRGHGAKLIGTHRRRGRQ